MTLQLKDDKITDRKDLKFHAYSHMRIVTPEEGAAI
nr:MAG TPA: hypothetical protein [Caudoviricetes sp.]